MPRLIEFSKQHQDLVEKQNKVSIILFMAEKDDSNYQKVFRQASDELHSSELLFVTALGSEPFNAMLRKNNLVKQEDQPAIRLFNS